MMFLCLRFGCCVNGSNVKLYIQFVEYDETPTKVGDVRNFQDNDGQGRGNDFYLGGPD